MKTPLRDVAPQKDSGDGVSAPKRRGERRLDGRQRDRQSQSRARQGGGAQQSGAPHRRARPQGRLPGNAFHSRTAAG